jgi:hypothetical protein
MPTLIKIGPYRFFFYSNEGTEPPHVHVQKENNLAKFWLTPVALASSSRFKSYELNEIERYVLENQIQFLEAWNEYFGS